MSFAWLPHELQSCIITHSLHAPPQPPTSVAISRTTSRSCAFDTKQALSLALVSSSCRTIVAKTLYRNIYVSRPSTLRQLSWTLEQSPELAALVRSIHIGPDTELAERGWPLRLRKKQRRGCPDISLVTSLSESLLPDWSTGAVQLFVDGPGCNDQSRDLGEAMSAAATALDVEPRRRRCTKSNGRINLRVWTARLFLLQAAFDVYLMEMRKLEDDARFRGSYPTLKIVPNRSPQVSAEEDDQNGEATDSKNALVVTTSELWQHIERRNGPADHFDSPILFTRCSRTSLDLEASSWQDVLSILRGPSPTGRPFGLDGPPRQQEDVNDGGARDSVAEQSEDWHSDSSGSDEQDQDLDPFDVPSCGVDDLLSLARSILTLTTNVSNLSLTSYLSRAFAALSRPEVLRSLNLGPQAGWWKNLLIHSGQTRMKSLAKLRVVGLMSSSDAAQICHELPALKEVEWIWPDPKASQADVYLVIHSLQGRHDRADPSNSLERLVSTSLDLRDPGDAPVPPRPAHAPASRRRVNVRLHPDMILFLYCEWSQDRGNQHIHTAWMKGKSVPGAVHTVKLSAIEGPPRERGGAESAGDAEKKMMEKLYSEGREWWEGGCTRGGVYGVS